MKRARHVSRPAARNFVFARAVAAAISQQPSAVRYRSSVVVSRFERATSAWHPVRSPRVRPSIYPFTLPWFAYRPRAFSHARCSSSASRGRSFVEWTRARAPFYRTNRGRIDSANDNRLRARRQCFEVTKETPVAVFSWNVFVDAIA